jgi:tRNA A-37 threonylcarbamoyl transferase component Bud32
MAREKPVESPSIFSRVDESLRRAFEAAWRSGRPPSLQPYLPAPSSELYLATLIEVVCIDLENRWKAMHQAASQGCDILPVPPMLEEYLARYPELSSDQTLPKLIQEEIRIREAIDYLPTLEELERRFPQLSGKLAPLLNEVTSSPATSAKRRSDQRPDVNAPTERFGLEREMAAGQETISIASRPPSSFGDYVLLRQIAAGAMGVVYEARQKSLDRIVALKFIHRGQLADQQDRRRFVKEAEHAAQLSHPHIVPVYEVGQFEDWPFFAMGFIDGSSLQQRMLAGPISPRQAAEIMATIADAVAYAHERGIVHRDLKPGNVMINEAGQPVVTDFGLAKRVDSTASVTETGQIMGTPAYMAPEQASGDTRAVGPHSDQYSLGVVLYELLTGRRPFDGPVHLLLAKVVALEPPTVRELVPQAPRDLEAICLKAMQKRPAKRYGSVREMAGDLQRYLRDEAILARRYGVRERLSRFLRKRAGVLMSLAGLLLASAITGLAVWLLQPPEPKQMPQPKVITAEEVYDRGMAARDSLQNLRAIGIAIHNYENVYRRYPPAAITDANGKPLLSWRVAILRYLGHNALYEKFHLDEPWDSPHNLTLLEFMPENYAIPKIPASAPHATYYRALVGDGATFDSAWTRAVGFADLKDGSSGTLIAVEGSEAVPWTKPEEINCNVPFAAQLGGPFEEGFHGLMADGDVRFFKSAIRANETALRALVGREDGEVANLAPYEGFPTPDKYQQPGPELERVVEKLKLNAAKNREIGQRNSLYTESMNNLKKLQLAMKSYDATYRHLPPAAIVDDSGQPLLSWRVALLPLLEEQALYQKFHLDEPWDSPHNFELLQLMPDCFRVKGPQLDTATTTYYQVLVGDQTPFPAEPEQSRRLSDIAARDGISKTLLIVEAGTAVPWTKPQDLIVPTQGAFPKLGGLFPIGFQGVMCNGSVRQFMTDIYADEPRLRAMSGYQDGILFQFAPYEQPFSDAEQPAKIDTRMDGVLEARKEAGHRQTSKNNLRKLALALHNYQNLHRTFPPHAVCDDTGRPLLSWRVSILPLIEEEALYRSFRLNEPWDSEHNRELLQYMPEVFASPLAPPRDTTFYQVPVGPGTAFDPHRRRGSQVVGTSLRDIRDGAKNTILLVEADEAVPWTKPTEVEISNVPLPKLGGIFPEGFHAATCDGNVTFVVGRRLHEEANLRALFGIADGISIDLRKLNDSQ